MNKESFVSVIIPTYNRAHLIGESIQSVMSQTYANWELIIVDDGSADDSKKIISKFNDNRIQYHCIEHCGIIAKVRNIGIKYANGDYIAFLDSDDLWLPYKLEFQLSLLRKYPKASFTFSHGEQFGVHAIPPPKLESLFVGNVFLPQLLEERFVLYPSTFLFKRDVLGVIGFLDERYSAGESDFFLRMAWKFEGVFSNELLVKLRKHHQNVSLERDTIFSWENIEMMEKFLEAGMLTRKQFATLASKQNYKIGLLHLQKGNPRESTRSFLNYIRFKPFHYKGWVRLLQASFNSTKRP